MNNQRLNESDVTYYNQILTERFGRPIGDSPSTVGVPDEREELTEKKKGPSKKTARKILKGTKTFKDKVKKVSSWAEDPEAMAGWLMKRADYKK
jgi:hypothetical protein